MPSSININSTFTEILKIIAIERSKVNSRKKKSYFSDWHFSINNMIEQEFSKNVCYLVFSIIDDANLREQLGQHEIIAVCQKILNNYLSFPTEYNERVLTVISSIAESIINNHESLDEINDKLNHPIETLNKATKVDEECGELILALERTPKNKELSSDEINKIKNFVEQNSFFISKSNLNFFYSFIGEPDNKSNNKRSNKP